LLALFRVWLEAGRRGQDTLGVAAHLFQPKTHPSLYGSERQVELSGDLAMAELAVERERDYLELLDGQVAYQRAQGMGLVAGNHIVLR
jgi:hypothetical protein